MAQRYYGRRSPRPRWRRTPAWWRERRAERGPRFTRERDERSVREPQGLAVTGGPGVRDGLVPQPPHVRGFVCIGVDGQRDAALARRAENVPRRIHDPRRIADAVAVQLDGGAARSQRVQSGADLRLDPRTRPVSPEPDVVEVGEDVEAAVVGRRPHVAVVGGKQCVRVVPARVGAQRRVVEDEPVHCVYAEDDELERPGLEQPVQFGLVTGHELGLEPEQDGDLRVPRGDCEHVLAVGRHPPGLHPPVLFRPGCGRDVVGDTDLRQPGGYSGEHALLHGPGAVRPDRVHVVVPRQVDRARGGVVSLWVGSGLHSPAAPPSPRRFSRTTTRAPPNATTKPMTYHIVLEMPPLPGEADGEGELSARARAAPSARMRNVGARRRVRAVTPRRPHPAMYT